MNKKSKKKKGQQVQSYDLKVSKAIRTIRKLCGFKQDTFAQEISMSQSKYCKIEKGYCTVSSHDLKIIADGLKISIQTIHSIAGTEELINFKVTTLSEMLIKFVLTFESEDKKVDFSEQELFFILGKIRAAYDTNQNLQNYSKME